MGVKVRGAIRHDILLIQHSCTDQFTDWLISKFPIASAGYELKTYCDGELYADFGNGAQVCFRDFLADRIAGIPINKKLPFNEK